MDLDGFIKYNNMSIYEIKDNLCKIKLEINSNSLNPYGIVHGRLIYSLCDTAMGVTCSLHNAPSVTVDSNINFLKPAKGKYLIATSEVVKHGKSIWVLRSNVYDDSDNLVAIATGTYKVI